VPAPPSQKTCAARFTGRVSHSIVVAITKPFGFYMTRVFVGEWTPLSPLLRPVERLVYRCCGVEESEEQSWRLYAISMVLFGATGFVTLYLWQRLQWYLPLNPQGQPGVEPVLAFNTGVSFVTNTNWQSYEPETTMGYLVQMAGLTVHNFVSAAVGVAIALALIRGFARREAAGIGNFWVDVTRITLYVLLPVSIVTSLVFVLEGVPQNLSAYVDATTLEGMKQTIAQGPVASQEVIKVLGTNGGGFFNANSAHPYENPTAPTNLMQMLLLIGIAAGLTNVLGRMGRRPAPGLGDLRRDGRCCCSASSRSIGRRRTATRPSRPIMSMSRQARCRRAATWRARRSASASRPHPRSRPSRPTRAAPSMRCTTASCRWAAWS
jgi:K+-transporting ATPase A subunit